MVKYISYSWFDIENYLKVLSEKIKKEEFDCIIGISRGGLVPARILSDYLEIKTIAIIGVNLYNGIKKNQKPILIQELNIDIKNKKILLVDDVSETGETLNFTKNILKQFKPKIIKTAVIDLKENSKYVPDFYVNILKDWIIYPWEKKEAQGY